ncbi:MAG: hypothetical protein CMQ15_09015 [Gammaproteobacteria bacterium]|mgnify:FL=1|jgi:hypothetical protein|nr:hypothetical protein [Gammaproteobacteria bacterium]HJN94558.1 hypothetical protein [Gammaproteobacteria bacterium]|tara:strand:+ start:16529 stop:16717 length:189 start_codon:yes stop_codon:yes gene_type:complete
MKNLILKNRYTLLLSVLSVYVVVVVIEGAITDREPDWLKFDNSLFTIDLRDIGDFADIDIDL